MKKTFLVIGLGAFGEAVARTLYEQGHTVVGVDINRERVERGREFTSEMIEGDLSDRETMAQVLESIGVDIVDTVIVGVGRRMEASILICLFLQEMNVNRIIAKVLTHEHARILKRLGVQKSLFPEADSGERLAQRLVNPNVEDLLHLGEKINVVEISTPEAFVGKSLAELEIRPKYKFLVVAIRRAASSDIEVLPSASSTIEKGDMLFLLGPPEAIEKLPK